MATLPVVAELGPQLLGVAASIRRVETNLWKAIGWDNCSTQIFEQ